MMAKRTWALLATAGLLVLAGCNKGPSYIGADSSDYLGSRTNSESLPTTGYIVNGTKNALSADFAYGADLSSVAEVEENGGVFYNENGVEQDVFKILANDGVNYARFRLWENPNSADGVSYGGGHNDLKTDLALAKRAKLAGMKVCLDFHLSDFWTDPDKAWAPKSFKGHGKAEYASLISAHVKDSLQAFKDASIHVDSVQIGNEINRHFVGIGVNYTAESTMQLICSYLQEGIDAAKSVFSDIQTIIHLTNVKSQAEVLGFAQAFKNNNLTYDIAGYSYYPYWHGTMDNLLTNLNAVEALIQKPIMIMETSYVNTDSGNDYTANMVSKDSAEANGGYLASEQGQLTEMADLCSLLSQVNERKGMGVFYWEPAWLPVKGSSWASAAGQKYADTGTDTGKTGTTYSDGLVTWANQSWFSFSGKANVSAASYKHIKDKDVAGTETVKSLVKDTLDLSINLAIATEGLPTTVQAVTNTDAYRDVAVTWNATEVAAMKAGGAGTYTIHGTANGQTITANVVAEYNLISDPGYELQSGGSATGTTDVLVTSPWKAETTGGTRPVHIDRKGDAARSGKCGLNWYETSASSFTVSQDLASVEAGTYTLSCYHRSDTLDDDGGYTQAEIWISINGTKTSYSFLDSLNGYAAGFVHDQITSIAIPAGATVSVGVSVAYGAKSWGHIDDWSLAKA
jgi:arabinogalactan endo-1,4-beta-galactosidase